MSGPHVLIDFYYDVVSPYSWIGFEIMERYSRIWPVTVRYRPVLLGGIMAAVGNATPAVPAKGAYLSADVERLGWYCNVPLKKPSNFETLMAKWDNVALHSCQTVFASERFNQCG